MKNLSAVDPEMAKIIQDETACRMTVLELNAAGSFPHPAVTEILGTVLSYRTLEGYPGRRYHGGHRYVDKIETLGIDRAKALFGAEHANIQPHSGVLANLAVYSAVLEPGDRILGMDLGAGGHLSHGSKASITGRFFRSFSYGVNHETEQIDYNEVRKIAHRVRPKMLICGGSAYPRVIEFQHLKKIADEVGAYLLADIAHVAGLSAAGAYPSPVPYADFVTFTTYKTFGGARGGTILSKGSYADRIDSTVFPGVQGSMHVHHLAAKATTFKIASTEGFRRYAQEVIGNARVLAGALNDLGYRVVSGGTDTHIVLLDLRPKGMTGAQAQDLLEQAGIVCNKNAVPFDSKGPERTGGLRLGTSSVTARGLGEKEMREVAEMLDTVLSYPEDRRARDRVRSRVAELCRRFQRNHLTDPPLHPVSCP